MSVEMPPPPPDADSESKPLVLAFGLIAGILGCIGAIAAWRSLGWFPPRHAALVLLASALVFLALGIVVGRLPAGSRRTILGAAVSLFGLVVLLLLAAFVPGVKQPAEHEIPGRPWIAVRASPDGSPDLYLMKGDPHHLVPFGETPVTELFSTLSPDRRHIVFAANPEGSYDLFVLDLDANGNPVAAPRRITSLPGDELGGDWSPDGTKIVFQEGMSGTTTIMVADASGQHAKVLETVPGAGDPHWSPAGRSIAFAAPKRGNASDYDIWVMSADGSHARDIVDAGTNDWWPNWSPDGTRIAFSDGYAASDDVYVVGADGTGLMRLTSRPGEDTAYGWAPGGSKVLFISDRSNNERRFIYMMDPDGSHAQLALRI